MAATSGYMTNASYVISGNRVLGGWGSASIDGIQGAAVTALRIDSPEVEIVNMTTISDEIGYQRLAAAGVATNGLITVDFLYETSAEFEVARLAATTGQLVITTQYGGVLRFVTYEVICKTARLDSRVGDVVKFQAQFIPTQASMET